MKRQVPLFLATIIALGSLLLVGCGGGGDGSGDGLFACSYEKRVTDGCDGYGFGDWEEGCFSFNADDYFITAEEVCANVTDGGVFCEAGCCIDTEYSNVNLSSGDCV